MFIIFGGSDYTAKVKKTIEKKCVCEKCGGNFSYRCDVNGVGTSISYMWISVAKAKERAHQRALKAMKKSEDTIFPLNSCPDCGHYQEKMLQQYRKQILPKFFIFSIFAIVLTLVVSLIFGSSVGYQASLTSKYFWMSELFFGGILLIVLMFRKHRCNTLLRTH